MSTRTLLSASAGADSKCRTVDVCDIFGGNSGKALYRLDGNANDESGNYHGTETAITYGGGVYERGAVFGATSSQITSAYTGDNDFTISFWMYPTNVTPPSFWQICGGSTATNNYSYFSAIEINGVITFRDSHAQTSLVSPTGSATINTWQLITLVKSGTSRTIYKNGISIASDNGGIATTLKPAGWLIGKYYASTSYPYQGNLDQVRIFNRAITSTEVATLYAECAPTSTVDNINPFEDGSLKALYQFNGDATDKTGVYNGTATNVTYGTGKFGNAITFAGTTTSKVTTPIQTIYSGASARTIAMWVKPTYTGTTRGNFFHSGANVSYGAVQLRYNDNNDSKFLVSLYNYALITSTGTYTTNTWNHVAFVYNGTVAYLYVNGKLDGSATYAINTTSGYGFVFGTTELNEIPFTGSIDQLRIFNKALTPMEVASLYNETTPLEEPRHSLVDPFKDGSGKALYRLDGNALDESGNYTGTATSMTYGAGRFGRAGVFNGTSSKIEVDTSLFNALMKGEHSISFWDYAATGQTQRSGLIIAQDTLNSNLPYINIERNATTGKYTFVSRTNSASLLNDSTQNVIYNQWVHIVLVQSATGAKAYINGVEVATAIFTAVYTTNSSDIMRIGTGFSSFSIGSMDQVRFFTRALTAGEVTTLYTEI